MKSSPSILPRGLQVTLLAICLAAPAVAQAPEVGQVTVASSVGSRLYSPSVAFSDGGSVLALWEDSRDGIQGRLINSDGSLEPPRQLAGNDLPASIPYHGPIALERDPVAVSLDGGDFLAIWVDEHQEVSVDVLFQDSHVVTSTIQVRRFNRTVRPAGRQFAVSDGDLGLESAPRAVRLASGRLAVVWQVKDSRQDPDGVYGRLVGGRGVPHGSVFRIDEPTEEGGRRPVVTALSDGGFMVAWQQCCDAGGAPDVLARRFDADGVAEGAPFVIHEDAAGEQVWPVLATGPDGDLLAAWMGPGAGQEGRDFRVYGQKLSADGTRLGPERVVSSGVSRAHGAPTLAALPDGYALIWTLWGQHFIGGVAGVPLDTAGVPRGDAVLLSSGSVRFQWDLALATDPAGRVLAAWQGFDPGGSSAINVWTLFPVE